MKRKRNSKMKVISLIILILIAILSVILLKSIANREFVSKSDEVQEGKSSGILENLFKGRFGEEEKEQAGILSSPSTTEFYGMSIESVTEDVNQITINTTGAMYVLNRTKMEMWRRIDPATNNYNQRLVAKLDFDNDIGPLNVLTDISTNKNYSIVNSTKANFTFNSDSFFIVAAKQQISFNYTNLIINATWNKGSGTERMWTDGFGGSLHAKTMGNPTALISGNDFTRFSLNENDGIGSMVFPPKKFDFERLYNESSRPLTHFIYSGGSIDYFINNINNYTNNNFGVVVLFALYNQTIPGYGLETPVLLDSGIMGYKFVNSTLINNLISVAHSRGFKVITYSSYPMPDSNYQNRWIYPSGHPLAGQGQNISTTLQWMREFQQEYDLDGWYFDNANAGTLLEDYEFIKQIRKDIGDEGIIYHHDSVDVWGAWSGLEAIMVDAYVDYITKGETGRPPPSLTAQVDEPNDAYLRFYARGYGMSQAISDPLCLSNSKCAIKAKEKNRVWAENLNGISTHGSWEAIWLSHTKQFYDARKNQYINDRRNFVYDPWPINNQTGWFRAPVNINVEFITGTTVNVSWETDSNSDSEVAYTSNEVWINRLIPEHNSVEGLLYDYSNLGVKHGLVIDNLINNTNYEFRIRSNNQEGGLGEIIWGQVGNFTTRNSDEDNDGMGDDWEMKYFGDLNRDGNGDFDVDNLNDSGEFNAGTDPTKKDSDCDGIEDGEEIIRNSDPIDWYNSTINICGNKICQYGENLQNCPGDCPQGLVGYWGFDCENAKDQSPNALDGTLHNVIWNATGGYNGKGAFEFGGNTLSPEYMIMPKELSNISTYGGAYGNSTIIAWIKTLNVKTFNVITHHMGGIDYFSAGSIYGNVLVSMARNTVNDVNFWPESTRSLTNEWTHVAFVFEGGKGYKYYINGMLDSEAANSNLAMYNYGLGDFPYIGYGWVDGNHFNGTIDEVRVYNRSLNQQEVCELAGGNLSGEECFIQALCGNGILQQGEQCDDGNNASGDGCSSTCATESSGGNPPGNGLGNGPGGPPATPQCRDNKDNDADGKIDYPNDTGCANRNDDSELNVVGIGGNCVEDWKCVPVGECLNGAQTLQCVDVNECGSENDKPGLLKECEIIILGKKGINRLWAENREAIGRMVLTLMIVSIFIVFWFLVLTILKEKLLSKRINIISNVQFAAFLVLVLGTLFVGIYGIALNAEKVFLSPDSSLISSGNIFDFLILTLILALIIFVLRRKRVKNKRY